MSSKALPETLTIRKQTQKLSEQGRSILDQGAVQVRAIEGFIDTVTNKPQQSSILINQAKETMKELPKFDTTSTCVFIGKYNNY